MWLPICFSHGRSFSKYHVSFRVHDVIGVDDVMACSGHELKNRSSNPQGYFFDCLCKFKFLGCWAEARRETNAFIDAVDALVDMGIVVVVSAGNTFIPFKSACLSTPGKSDKVITVGGSTPTNQQWLFSRTGRCVDIFAPAVDVVSAWYSSDRAFSVQSGTSVSAPMVAGVAALYLQRDPTMTPAAVKQAIIDDAVSGLQNRGLFSPDRLVSTVKLI